MRVAPALAFVAVAACGGPDAAAPRARATVQVVQCAPAQPPPTMSSENDPRMVAELGIGTIRVVPKAKLFISISDVAIETGAFDPTAVRRALTPSLPHLQACYARDTASASATAKSLKLRFTILPNGTIAGLREVADGRTSTPTCVRNVLEGMAMGARPRVGSALVAVGLQIDAPKREPGAVEPSREPWTPFALDHAVPDDSVALVARATEAALQRKRDVLAACFPPTSPTGSLRLLLDLGRDGALLDVRAGGLGDARIESCVRAVAMDLQIARSGTGSEAIACDLAHGDAEPWRVTPSAGYRVIQASPKQLTYGKQTLAADAKAPSPLNQESAYLLVADPDTRGSVLTLGLSWAYDGGSVLVALRDPRMPQSPRFLGMGLSTTSAQDDESDPSGLPAVRLGPASITACVNRTTQVARLAEPALVSALLQNVATKCKALACGRTLVVALDPQAIARDLVEVTGAARRAGFDRILIGGDVCGGTRPGPAVDDADDADELLEDDAP